MKLEEIKKAAVGTFAGELVKAPGSDSI